MTSQMGSLPRPARSALENARSVATGTVRSAMLTYFGQIVIQQMAATKGSCPRPRPEPIAPEAQARSHGRPKHTGCRPATQKHKDGDDPAPAGAGPSPRRHAMAEKPYDRLEGVIWYDGKLVPWGEATLHVLSHGLHYASSVFEGERAYGGEIFKCTEHSQRLKRSAELLDFDIPYSVAEIDAAKRLVLEK